VEDTLWITVYIFNTDIEITGTATGGVFETKIKPIVSKEVAFVFWQYTSDGKLVNIGASTKVGDKTDLYADIEYKVYSVEIDTCDGIDDVFMDGVLVNKNEATGQYVVSNVAAGQHSITYTLKNGYSGTATMLVNGDKVTGNTFTASGDYKTTTYTIILQGIEKSGYIDPVQPEQKDDGMSVTDYLLIILVVLIVVMAIILAMRMMRN